MSQLPPELAYDVLSVADMYLLPGLKRLCGRSLAQLLEEDSVVGVWRIAKMFRWPGWRTSVLSIWPRS